MKCDLCGERNAVIFVQQVSRNSTVELHLCEACARERGFSTTENKIDISLGSLFSGIADDKSVKGGGSPACPACGFTVADIRKKQRVGCADCYRLFRAEIVALLRGNGIEIGYAGDLPAQLEAFTPAAPDPATLEAELKKAIEAEDYELAAYYRDRLRAMGGDK